MIILHSLTSTSIVNLALNYHFNLKSSKLIYFSQQVTGSLVDQVVADHAAEVHDMREKVEGMWSATDMQRLRRTAASTDCPGFSLGGDNVGNNNFIS